LLFVNWTRAPAVIAKMAQLAISPNSTSCRNPNTAVIITIAITTSQSYRGTQRKSRLHVEEDDPLSAVADLQRTWTMPRKTWQIRIETQMRLSCNRDVFLLQGNLRAREGANENCHRGWDRSTPRDLL
jgi:autotransporter translocation and assembly factor TamB